MEEESEGRDGDLEPGAQAGEEPEEKKEAERPLRALTRAFSQGFALKQELIQGHDMDHEAAKDPLFALKQFMNQGPAQEMIMPYLELFTMGGGIGFFTGMAGKRMGKQVGHIAVSTALAIQILDTIDFIDIRWDNIENRLNDALVHYGDSAPMKFILANGSALAIGLALGFHFG